MSRNGSGTYVLPEPAFVPNTAISSAAMNSDLSDIADALTESLARDGQGGMAAVLPLANTGFTYLTDPNTGMRRTAADTQAISGGGVDIVTVSPTGITVTGNLEVTGGVTSDGAALIPIGLGPLPWSGLTAPTKWLLCYGQTLNRADYPDLWTFIAAEIAGGNTLFTNGDGSTTFTMPDMRGRLPAGKDNMGGVAASRLTGITISPNATTLGAVNGGLTGETVTLGVGDLPTGIASANSGAISLSVTSTNFVHNNTSTTGDGSSPGGGSQRTWGIGVFTSQIVSTGTILGGNAAVTSTNTGGGAHANVQPTIITNSIIYAGG